MMHVLCGVIRPQHHQVDLFFCRDNKSDKRTDVMIIKQNVNDLIKPDPPDYAFRGNEVLE